MPSQRSEQAEAAVTAPITCGECHRGFSRRADLRRHVQHTHGNRRKFYCPVVTCNRHEYSLGGQRPFYRRDNLRQHITRRHPDMAAAAALSPGPPTSGSMTPCTDASISPTPRPQLNMSLFDSWDDLATDSLTLPPRTYAGDVGFESESDLIYTPLESSEDFISIQDLRSGSFSENLPYVQGLPDQSDAASSSLDLSYFPSHPSDLPPVQDMQSGMPEFAAMNLDHTAPVTLSRGFSSSPNIRIYPPPNTPAVETPLITSHRGVISPENPYTLGMVPARRHSIQESAINPVNQHRYNMMPMIYGQSVNRAASRDHASSLYALENNFPENYTWMDPVPRNFVPLDSYNEDRSEPMAIDWDRNQDPWTGPTVRNQVPLPLIHPERNQLLTSPPHIPFQPRIFVQAPAPNDSIAYNGNPSSQEAQDANSWMRLL